MLSKQAREFIDTHPNLKEAITEAYQKVQAKPRIERISNNQWRYARWQFTRRDSGVVLGSEHIQAHLPILVGSNNQWLDELSRFSGSEHLSGFFSALHKATVNKEYSSLQHHISKVYYNAITGNTLRVDETLPPRHRRRPTPQKAFLKEVGGWFWYEVLNPEIAHYTLRVFGHRATIAQYNLLAPQYELLKTYPINLIQFWARLLDNSLLHSSVAYRHPSLDDIKSDLIEVAGLSEEALEMIQTLSPGSSRYLAFGMQDPNKLRSERAWYGQELLYDTSIEVLARVDTLSTACYYYSKAKKAPRYTMLRTVHALKRSTLPNSICLDVLQRIDQELTNRPRTNLTQLSGQFAEPLSKLANILGPDDASTLLTSIKTDNLPDYFTQIETALDLYDLQGRREYAADTFPF